MEHLKIKYVYILILLSVGITSCYYDVEEEIYGTTNCSDQNMSYQNDIIPILSENCYQCHSAQNNFGNVTLEGHNRLLQYVNSGQLLGAIKHDSGYSPMPKNASMLLECQIEKIESWINEGSMNN